MELLSSFIGSLLLISAVYSANINFDKNYKVIWGFDHVVPLNQGSQIQLSLDKSSGAGFESKLSYGSGYFHMKIKLPHQKYTAGVVTAFYLTSKGNNHDELDFEFLGNREGQPITVQTNVFVNGVGNREHRVRLWFDPSAQFHDYAILWNQHQIVFFVDGTPIRVFKYTTGANFPSTRPMQVEASLWDGSDWATDNGRYKIDWNLAPFKAYFKGFNINGCWVDPSSTGLSPCLSTHLWWNSERYWKLNPAQQRAYENVKNKYLIYDYCSDRNRYPVTPPECVV